MQITPSKHEQLFPNGRMLVCSPSYYDVSYEINPWMSIDRVPVKPRAAQQWQVLQHTLTRLGVWLEYITPTPGLPDLVFTANAGLVIGANVMLSRFRWPERQREEPLFKSWFEANGFATAVPKTGFFEGAGDAMMAGHTLFAAYGFRTDPQVYDELRDFFGISKIVHCELVDRRFYHCDTCFCPLSDSQAIFYPGGFSQESLRRMEQHIELLAVPEDEALKFACNAVVAGTSIILPAGCPLTAQLVAKAGYTPYELELDEFIKAGGACKCLTLKL